jgi:hypothetical protein
VQLDVEYVERRSRLTTFFRWILAIPHLIFAALYGIVAGVVVFIAWFAILFTGRFPQGMYNLVEGFAKYYARVIAYYHLASDPFPPFSGDGPYQVGMRFERPERHSRLTTFFRSILAIPALIITYLLNIAIGAVGFILWLVIVFTGKAPEGLVNFQAMCLRYTMRYFAYVMLLVDRYPSFEEPQAEAPPQPPQQAQPAV